MKLLTTRTWQRQRATLSAQFDLDSYKVARALLALLSRELISFQQQKAGILSPRNLNQLAQSLRKTQEMGRMALGETIDRQQLELKLESPEIQLRVIYDDAPAKNDKLLCGENAAPA